jgi:hypothetical protein
MSGFYRYGQPFFDGDFCSHGRLLCVFEFDFTVWARDLTNPLKGTALVFLFHSLAELFQRGLRSPPPSLLEARERDSQLIYYFVGVPKVSSAWALHAVLGQLMVEPVFPNNNQDNLVLALNLS